jgi:hypothetical protein
MPENSPELQVVAGEGLEGCRGHGEVVCGGLEVGMWPERVVSNRFRFGFRNLSSPEMTDIPTR